MVGEHCCWHALLQLVVLGLLCAARLIASPRFYRSGGTGRALGEPGPADGGHAWAKEGQASRGSRLCSGLGVPLGWCFC